MSISSLVIAEEADFEDPYLRDQASTKNATK